ncbi:hypothetical protein Cob_v003393 [Colletotrichum orbiculare MAFF 240422]|uniref:Rhodopsin domain-containing protein n=1 Tax=Colletotrichum orbiculare (strain 104-T / ATCC 96160 / CBS 514.97 / LARS 414 / MAFF 240422) TaxID=1213857 RepID=N4VJ18_COLOR|nr:hypothetical protein Cob_v003393 [Colletotrichum orbiculare MAFF 240422]
MPPEGSDEWKAQDKGPEVLLVCWILTVIATIFVFARIYVRYKVSRKFLSDDWICLLSLICVWLSSAFISVAIHFYSYGKHMEVLSREQQKGAVFWSLVAITPGILSYTTPKLAVAILLVRLMNPTRYHQWFLWSLTLLCTISQLVAPPLHFLRCVPVEKNWNMSIDGKCFKYEAVAYYSVYAGAISAVTDVYLAVYPAVVLFGLQMSLKKKIGLSLALGVGAVGGVFAILKTATLPNLDKPDATYHTADLRIRTTIEGSTLIIASTIPVLQPLLELAMRRNPFSSAEESKQTPKYYEDCSSRRDSRGGSHIELGQRRPRPKPRDDLGLTIMEGDSQEEILPGAKRSSPVGSSRGAEGAQAQSRHGDIIRTDVVCVSYEKKSPLGENLASNRWNIE